MRISPFCSAALVAAMFVSGCNKPAPTGAPINSPVSVTPTSTSPSSADVSAKGSGGGGVAVIDLDKVAKRLGRDTEMAALLEQKKQLIESKLSDELTKKNKEFSDKKVLIGDKPSDDQKKELALVFNRLQGEFNQQMQMGQNVLSQEQAALIIQFKKDVEPYAEKAAKARGLSVVLVKNEMLVFKMIDESIDITDAVIEAMPPAKIKIPEPAKVEPTKSDAGKTPPKADPPKIEPSKVEPAKTPAPAPADKGKTDKK